MTDELFNILVNCTIICADPYENNIALDTTYNGHHIRKCENSLAAVVIDNQVINMGVINDRYPNGSVTFQVNQVSMTGIQYVRYRLTGLLPMMVTCPNCGARYAVFPEEVDLDEFGYLTWCDDCDTSFDVDIPQEWANLLGTDEPDLGTDEPDLGTDEPDRSPTHTINGQEIPDSILLENGIHFTKEWMDEQANARPYLTENKLRYWAAQISKTIVVRTEVDGCTHDERRPSTQSEQEVLFNLAYSALLGLNAGETNRKSRDAENAIINAIEYTCLLMLPQANSYDTIYLPLRRVIKEWQTHTAEELPVIASDFPRDHETSTHVEYTDGSEEWLETRYTVSYEGVVFEGDWADELNFWHTDSTDKAHEFYNYCELRGLDPQLTDNHYGVTLYRGDWN